MKKTLETINQAKKNNKKIYIRGFSEIGFNLGICLNCLKVSFDGYYDIDVSKIGKVDYKGIKCYSADSADINSFVLCAVQNEDAKQKIAAELGEKGIEYIFISDDTIYEIKCHIDDERFLKEYYFCYMGKPLDIENPKTLCEKLQWLKLYDHNPRYTNLVDKYDVRKFVTDTIGEKYLVPNCGVWKNFDDIDFNALPQQFVLKCTHNSGCFFVVKDKNNFDKEKAKRILEAGLKRNYFYSSREWVYKNVEPRIIADKYIDTLGNPDSVEYKITCFNGKVDFVTFCKGKAHADFSERTNDHYDRNFEKMKWYVNYKNTDIDWQKPAQWEELIEISEKLAKDIPYVRCDFYIDGDKIYFGEMTFYTWSGIMPFEPKEWDRKLGDKLLLPSADLS